MTAACALLAAPAAAAGAAPTRVSGFYISGGGFGHGVGMSQYGAAGMALHGYTYQQILAHYYTGTTLGQFDSGHTVTVLLHQGGAASFSGASTIAGSRVKLDPGRTYTVTPAGSGLKVTRPGRTLGTFSAPLSVGAGAPVSPSGTAPLTVVGLGGYLGELVFRPGPTGGVVTVNALDLEDYVRGVVSAEMPTGWPSQALDAQAVAARTYAVASSPVSPDYELYDDTRSQMYEGVKAETSASDAAVAATTGQVVQYAGRPALTYYFASSGGHTESVQNVFAGTAPEPWLLGVPDPYDDSYNNPYYQWLDRLTVAAAARRLGAYYTGTFEGIHITQTGVSPRVISARVVGTGGSATVTGPQLQRLFATPSTDMMFATLTATGRRSPRPVRATKAPPGTPVTTTNTTPPSTTTTIPAPPPSGGGGLASAARARRLLHHRRLHHRRLLRRHRRYLAVAGTIYPAQVGATVFAQSWQGGAWVNIARAQLTVSGKYLIPVTHPGTYRVIYDGINGPNVRVR
ncbi:MAG: SpoIID/LytB domain-containing protein [Solirubrobacteraceae bacterium]